MTTRPPLVTLVILDGFGYTTRRDGNAIAAAHTPVFDRLWQRTPHTLLSSSGEAVGLPDGQMGNSEVGHMHVGAGRVIYQKLTLLNKLAREGDFERNTAIQAALAHVLRRGSRLHLMGLIGPGGVHALSDHLYALLRTARSHGVANVAIHAMTDGRDTPPQSALGYLDEVEEKIAQIGVGTIATVSGRYYAMDRDNRWERTGKAYRAYVAGDGPRATSARQAILASYEAGVNDEFILPTVIIAENDQPIATVGPHDAVIFFNFRNDRPRQLTRAFVLPSFESFDRGHAIDDLFFVTMCDYEANLPVQVAYPPAALDQEGTLPLAGVVSEAGLGQLHAAESEKYAHVTFFINGGREEPFPGEDRILVPSPKVATYDLQPDMSAREIARQVTEAMTRMAYGLVIVNFANCDMVGHTGVMSATVQAVETVDWCVGQIIAATQQRNGIFILTADHGNCEQMIDYQTGQPHTAHTTNPVPFCLAADSSYPMYQKVTLRPDGSLADVAPTVLDVLGLRRPSDMTGRSLVVTP